MLRCISFLFSWQPLLYRASIVSALWLPFFWTNIACNVLANGKQQKVREVTFCLWSWRGCCKSWWYQRSCCNHLAKARSNSISGYVAEGEGAKEDEQRQGSNGVGGRRGQNTWEKIYRESHIQLYCLPLTIGNHKKSHAGTVILAER